MSEQLETSSRHCNACGHHTNHRALWSGRNDWSVDEHPEVSGWVKHTVFQCCGCDAVSFEICSWESEDALAHGDPNDYAGVRQVYPPKTLRPKPSWYWEVSEHAQLQRLLDEVYVALQNDCPRLAAMGIRALLEAIMVEGCGDQGSFKKNLQKSQELGRISNVQCEAVEPVLDVGHAAIHRSFEPNWDQVVHALDIVENIIESIYVSTERAGRVRANPPPPRKPRR
jgi:hypothetical protein